MVEKYVGTKVSPQHFMQQRLNAIQERHLYRQLRSLVAGAEAWLEVDGRKALNLSSNNYLGLASRPELQQAVVRAAEAESCGTGSSRLIAGNSELHIELEDRMAAFKHSESALLFNSGYVANVGILSAITGAGDLIFSDELNHASIIDGCRLSRATCRVYPHCNVTALEQLFVEATHAGHQGRIAVVTDTVFSMDGDVAPLREIVALCDRYNALMVVDEAHATGCLGPNGQGLVAALGIQYEGLISVNTLSKALGSFGACMTGSALVREYLINVSRNFIFTTALPAPVVASALAALEIVEREPELAERLQANGAFFRQGLQQLGFDTLTSETHIIPVLVGDEAIALEMTARLLELGVFAVAIRPPTVPPGTARIRTSVMATHTHDDLSFALDAFGRVGRQLGIR